MDYFACDSGIDLATQQSFDFLELNVGAQSFCVPEVQNREQRAAPPQFDARPNREPMDHDQAIDVSIPQASLLLTEPGEISPDNGAIT